MKRILIFIVFTICYSCEILADTDIESIQELYIKSGLKKQLNTLPDMMRAQIQEKLQNASSSKKLSAEDIEIFFGLVTDVFNSPDIEADITDYLSKKTNNEDVRQILMWLNSSTGIKMTQAEEYAMTPEAYSKLETYVRSLSSNPPTQQYLDNIKMLAKNMRAVESTVNMVLNTQLATLMSVTIYTGNYSPDAMKKITQQLENARPNITASMAQDVLISLLFTYKDLPEKELQDYVNWTATDVSHIYHAALTEAINKAFINAGKKLGTKIMQLLELKSKNSNT